MKRCASCTSASWTPLDHGAWRSGGSAAFLDFLPSESELCLLGSLNSEQHFRETKGINSRKALGTGLDDEVPEFSIQVLLRCSKQVPNFLPESLSKPAKPWQS